MPKEPFDQKIARIRREQESEAAKKAPQRGKHSGLITPRLEGLDRYSHQTLPRKQEKLKKEQRPPLQERQMAITERGFIENLQKGKAVLLHRGKGAANFKVGDTFMALDESRATGGVKVTVVKIRIHGNPKKDPNVILKIQEVEAANKPKTARELREDVLDDLDDVIRSKGYGYVSYLNAAGKRYQTFKREGDVMEGAAAAEFAEQSQEAEKKYEPFVREVKRLAKIKSLDKPEILDLGSGPAILDIKIAGDITGAKITAVDGSFEMTDIARSKIEKAGLSEQIQTVKGNILELPPELAGKFDLVISRNVLHRIERLALALEQALASAKPNGTIYAVAFVNPVNFSTKGLKKFYDGILERENRPNLQKSWTLAYLNAHTLDIYEDVVDVVAKKTGAKSWSVKLDGKENLVNILIQK